MFRLLLPINGLHADGGIWRIKDRTYQTNGAASNGAGRTPTAPV